MNRMTFLIPILLLPIFLAADDSNPRLHFKLNGFSIAPLEGTAPGGKYQVLSMFLPPVDGFAANVNVQVQPYQGTPKQYADLSNQQFESVHFNVLKQTISDTSVTFEYSGTVQNRELHWYAKAELANGKAYLATATALESQWESVSPKLKECVDSFQRD